MSAIDRCLGTVLQFGPDSMSRGDAVLHPRAQREHPGASIRPRLDESGRVVSQVVAARNRHRSSIRPRLDESGREVFFGLRPRLRPHASIRPRLDESGRLMRSPGPLAIPPLQFGPDSMSRGDVSRYDDPISVYKELQFGPDSMSRGESRRARSRTPFPPGFNSAPTR